MRAWVRFVSGHPAWTLAAVVAFTLFSLAGLVDLRTGEVRLAVDPSTGKLLPSAGPERELYERSRKLFGTDESIVVALGADDVFAPDALRRVVALTRRLEAIDGVQGVLSLATAKNIRAEEDDVFVAPIIPEAGVPDDPAELERMRRETLGNPLYAGTLVARDSGATALVVSLERMSDREFISRGIDPAIVAAAHAEAGELDVWIAGVPHQKVYTSEVLNRELRFMLPVILVVLGGVVLFALRTLRGLLLVHTTIAVALVWTLGTLGWLGQELNVVTITLPFLILTIGFADAVHVVAEYYTELREHGHATPGAGVHAALEAVGAPLVACGVTTGIGFISLAVNPLPAVSQFGLFSLLGVAFTLLASLTLTPAGLALLPLPRRLGRAHEGWLEPAGEWLASIATRRRRAMIVSAVALLAVAVIGMTQIRVAIKFPGNSAPDNPIRVHHEQINARLGGANQLRVVIDARERDGILEPAHLAAIRSLQDWLEERPDVGETASIVDYLMLLNRALKGDDPGAFAVPATRALASQLLLFGASDQTQRLLDAPRRTATLLVNVTVGDSDRIAELVDAIGARLAEFPPGIRGSVTGGAALLVRATDDVARGQWLSMILAFGLIYLVLATTFTSPRMGALALFPNALPIFVYYGALGFTGVTLSLTTSLIGPLALGVAVDDTIHYFARFNNEARRLADETRAAVATMRAVIRPLVVMTAGLAGGFLVLVASEQGSLVQFGVLAAFTVVVGLLTEVTLTPALCSGTRIVTLWDVLRLDLGPRPEQEIELFRGLRLRQARIFALMSDIRRVAAGERLWKQGDPADDMYVILGGELVASVERGGTRRELARMTRGTVVGEVGYFEHERTASVDVASDALLIRFDVDDLERLRRRNPRIAAVVLRNLNQMQAKRLSRTTQLVQ